MGIVQMDAAAGQVTLKKNIRRPKLFEDEVWKIKHVSGKGNMKCEGPLRVSFRFLHISQHDSVYFMESNGFFF